MASAEVVAYPLGESSVNDFPNLDYFALLVLRALDLLARKRAHLLAGCRREARVGLPVALGQRGGVDLDHGTGRGEKGGNEGLAVFLVHRCFSWLLVEVRSPAPPWVSPGGQK